MLAFDFDSPNIEVAEISEDKKIRQIRSRTFGKRLRYYIRKFIKTYHVSFLTRCSCKPG